MPSRLSILVVERDPHVRQLAAHFLAADGHSVAIARDGHDALAQLATVQPDLVITEILLPGLDGLALCRRLKANPSTQHIRVIVLSILAAAARSKEAGADSFMLKPLAQHRLIAMVQELATQRSDPQQLQENP